VVKSIPKACILTIEIRKLRNVENFTFRNRKSPHKENRTHRRKYEGIEILRLEHMVATQRAGVAHEK
jgi:hypothetical protein